MLQLLAVASSLLLLACGQCGASSPSPDDAPAPDDRALVEIASADAFVTLIVRPARWSSLRDAVAASLPGPVGAQARAADTPWALAAALTDGAVAIETALPSLDTSRSAALGLFVTAQPDLLEAAQELTATLDGKGVIAIRHRLVLPATDSSKLAAELRTLLGARGVELVDASEPGASTFAAVHPDGDHVRLELVTDDAPPGDKPDKAWRDAWSARLSASPRAVRTVTAGLHRALVPDAFVSAWVQTSRMRATAGAMGATQVAAALRHVDPEMRKVLLSIGTAEIMSGFALLSPERALVHDVGLALDAADGGLVLTSVASLIPRGKALFEAATRAATPVAEPAAANADASRVTLRLSLRDLHAAVEIPSVFAGASERDLAEAAMECGAFCRASLHGMLALFKRALAQQPADLQASLPRSLALVGVTPATPDATSAFALALGYAPGELPKATLERLRGDLPKGVTLSSGPTDGGELAYLASGMDPASAFKPGQPGPLWAAELDLDALSDLLDAAGGDRLPRLGWLVARTDLTGATLSSTLALSAKDRTRRLEPVDYGRFEAAPAPALTPATECLERAVHAVAASWKAIEQAPPELRQGVLTKARADMEAPLVCAEGDPATKASAAILRRLLTRF